MGTFGDDICYLCGKLLGEEKTDKDHVPPKQFFPKQLRGKFNLQLQTLTVHKKCNSIFQHDEDYFLDSIGPTALGSKTGNFLWNDINKRVQRPQGLPLALKVHKEFQDKIGSIYLPPGIVVKKFDGKRVWGIIWKITRGLYFIENKRYLPETTPHRGISIGYEPGKEFEVLGNAEERGLYRGIFAYKYREFEKIDRMNVWAYLFWNKIIVVLQFEHPDCECEIRKELKAGA